MGALAATGWVGKLCRRQPEPTAPALDADAERDDPDPAGTPEDQLQAKQSAQEALLGDVFAFLS